jgi:hypothetical protein
MWIGEAAKKQFMLSQEPNDSQKRPLRKKRAFGCKFG